MTHIELKTQLGDCFKMLAACFYEPNKEMFIQERLCEKLSSLFFTLGCADAKTATHNMKQALIENSDEEMKVEYASLFVGPFELIAPPYGSVYLEKTRRLMGDSTMAVLNKYREAGLKIDVKEQPDHIAIELEFMHYLYCMEAAAIQEDDHEKEINTASLSTRFLTTCLSPWVHPFCQNIKTGTNNLFYTNLAVCLEVFIELVSEPGTTFLAENSTVLEENATPTPV